MEQVCPNCGTARVEREFCFCASPVPSPHDPRPDVPYLPSWRWHCVGFAAWLLTVGAAVQTTGSQAYLLGAMTGALIVPVTLRFVYVVVFARGRQLWARAFLSPWVRAIGIVLNTLSAAGHHPH